MLKSLVLSLCAAAFFACCPAPAPVAGESEAGVFEVLRLHTLYKMKVSNDCSAGAALVQRGGKLLHEEYYGTLDRTPGSPPVTAESRFPLFSISKEFGVAVLFMMVTEGLIGLDDPVSKYLPYFTGNGGGEFDRAAVTVRQLTSQTSGVHRPGGMYDGSDEDFSDVTLEYEPGKGWRYTELGMRLLRQVMETAGGKPYEQLLRERLLDPLGLTSVGYLREGDPLDNIVRCCNGLDSSFVYYSPKPYPGSGLYATLRDVVRLGQFWLDRGKYEGRALFDEALVDEAWRNYNPTGKPHDDYEYGTMFWLSSEENAAFMAGAAQSVAAILPDQDMVILVGLNQLEGAPGWGRPPVEHSNVARLGQYLAGLLDRQARAAQ